jgi:hypothetical protein
MLAELRRARYGYLLALPLLLLCAAGRSPTAIAAGLFCARSRGSRGVTAYRAGRLGGEEAEGGLRPPVRLAILSPARKRSLLVILKAVPRACGWWRTRWSCATGALEWQGRRGIAGSAETVRRGLPEWGWVWKRAKLAATDDAPQRVERWARIRSVFESLRVGTALLWADELALSWLPKGGYPWMPKGEQGAVLTPGTN